MKAIFLYAEVMGYTLATMRVLAARGVELHVVHWDKQKLTPFQIADIQRAKFYARSSMSLIDLQDLMDRVRPDVVYVSGWDDAEYLEIGKRMRRRGIPVVWGVDGQWRGTPRQLAGELLGSIGYFRGYFSHAWVSGARQFEYVRRLGFRNDQIIHDLYSADLDVFAKGNGAAGMAVESVYPRRFLFVGRYVSTKGLDLLLDAWKKLANLANDWELHCIGNGPLRATIEQESSIVVHDFMEPRELVREMEACTCLVLPSRVEPWGVVLHEAAAAARPIICSDVCGAASSFVIDHWNGYLFCSGSADALAEKMTFVMSANGQELVEMGSRSRLLAGKITPETSAANFLSVVQ